MNELKTDRESIRLDRFLRSTYVWMTQGVVCAALRKKHIRVNDKPAKPDQRITPQDVVQVDHHVAAMVQERPPEVSKKGPTTKQMDVWHQCLMVETEHYCVLSKPAGLAMQGGSGIRHSLDDILSHFQPRYHLVHRLDRDTSGVCLVAKNADAAMILGKLFKEHAIRKTYHCMTQGVPAELEGVVRTPVDELDALTRYKVLAHIDTLAWVACFPHTGRKHQIRKHMVELGAPILGDQRYNRRAKSGDVLQLHAHAITLPALWGQSSVTYEAPHPPAMRDILKKHGWF